MNINLKKKRSLFAIAFLCLVVLVGITIAYFTSTSNIENIFNAGTYKTVTTEVFTSPSNWAPGDETPKTISTKNEGTIPVRVRVKFDESWTSKNDADLPLQYNNENVAIINLDNEIDWIKNGDYYYYVHELESGESTTSLIESVTFNPNIPSDVNCTSSNGVYTCESTGDGYDGAQYKLNITTETVQANKYEEVWENVPIMYDYVGDNPCTYNGDLEIGTEYVNGQYTYRYRQRHNARNWVDFDNNGWGVYLTNHSSTEALTDSICSSINNKPIVTSSFLYYRTNPASIDFRTFDFSNIVDISSMFYGCNTSSIITNSDYDFSKIKNMNYLFKESNISNIDLSNMKTDKVKSMREMFAGSSISQVDTSNWNLENITDMSYMFSRFKGNSIIINNDETQMLNNTEFMFSNSITTNINIINLNTSNVTSMFGMFNKSVADILDLSSFDTSNVTNTKDMFNLVTATTGYARTQADADRFNASTNKPAGLTFVVKNNG